MPPEPTWIAGRAGIIEFFSTVPAGGKLQTIRLVPIGSNRQSPVGAFIAAPEEEGHRFYGVMVFEMDADAISTIVGFAEPEPSDSFGLPALLPSSRHARKRQEY
jgi:RNA polymerase sigma-70 factor (ECF subfamily)